MIASPQQPYLTPDKYLQMEDVSNIKHEYIDGQVEQGLWVLQSYTPTKIISAR